MWRRAMMGITALIAACGGTGEPSFTLTPGASFLWNPDVPAVGGLLVSVPGGGIQSGCVSYVRSAITIKDASAVADTARYQGPPSLGLAGTLERVHEGTYRALGADRIVFSFSDGRSDTGTVSFGSGGAPQAITLTRRFPPLGCTETGPYVITLTSR